MSDRFEFLFGVISTMLYGLWGAAAISGPEPHRAWMLWFYACANVAILWPVLRRLL